MPLPLTFLEHLRIRGYDSRSDKHSNALAEAVLGDLLRSCPLIAKEAASGELVYQLNMKLQFSSATWNTTLCLGFLQSIRCHQTPVFDEQLRPPYVSPSKLRA
jgi:hypothetical protein